MTRIEELIDDPLTPWLLHLWLKGHSLDYISDPDFVTTADCPWTQAALQLGYIMVYCSCIITKGLISSLGRFINRQRN